MDHSSQPPKNVVCRPRLRPLALAALALASMILGIVATVLCCLPAVGPVCGILAIVLYVKFNNAYNAASGLFFMR